MAANDHPQVIGKIKFGSSTPARSLVDALNAHSHGVAAAPSKQDRIIELLSQILDELKLIKREINLKRS